MPTHYDYPSRQLPTYRPRAGNPAAGRRSDSMPSRPRGERSPRGHISHEAASERSRKGWVTRRENAAARGIDIGSTVGHPYRGQKRPVRAEKPHPGTRDVRRASDAELARELRHAVVVEHENADAANRRLGTRAGAKLLRELKAQAGWYWRHVVTESAHGMRSGHDEKVAY